MTISGILSLALWLPSRGSGSIASFAALYGLFSGESNETESQQRIVTLTVTSCHHIIQAQQSPYFLLTSLPSLRSRNSGRDLASLIPLNRRRDRTGISVTKCLTPSLYHLGSIFTVAAVATLAGSPTAGAFLKQVDQRHFNSLIIFTGVLVLVGSAFFGLARIVHSRRLWAKI